MKDLCQKWKIKLMFRGAYRLSGTGIIECLEIIDVWYNLKQFDGLTGLILTPPPPDFTTDLRHCFRRRQINGVSTRGQNWPFGYRVRPIPVYASEYTCLRSAK